MRHERTDFERLADNAVLLSLWAQAQQRAGGEFAGDRIKLMKLAFVAAYPLFWDRVKALNLRFYRWYKGPMANQVYDTWGQLAERGFLIDEEVCIVTEEGLRLAESFTEEVLKLEQNAEIFRTVHSVVEEYAPLETPDILERVYNQRWYTLTSPGRKQPIRSIPHGREFTGILEEDEADSILVMPPGWQMTLDLAFHPDALRNLQRGIEDFQAGRVLSHAEMWGDV
jgi:hypothetical protein